MNKPKIRFKGYEDDWEQRKFSEFVKNVVEKNKENLDLEPYAVTNDRGFIAQKDAHDDFGYMKDTDRKAYNIVPPNSFAYNPARINVGSLGYYTGAENVIVSSLYEVFQTEEYIDDRFLWHWLKSDHFPKWIEKLQEGSVRLYFYFDKLVQCEMMIPSLEEQKQISTYLDNLDTHITLHQRKCEETKTLKKYMLQKMFSRNGTNVPEIRFDGFIDAWEQRKVKWLIDESVIETPMDGNHGEKHPTANEYVDNGIPFLMASDIHNGEADIDHCKCITRERAEKLDKGFAKNGDVLITHKATIGETAILQGLKEEYAVLTPQVTYYRIRNEKQLNREYLYAFFNSEDFQNDLKTKAAQSTRPYIGISAQQNLVIDLPQNEKEQKQIGEFFWNLDHLITLHQRKCDELVKIKKYMLQNMFV